MARIKTREVDRTSIKTMNRSVSASHRIRNAGAEIRQNVRRQTDVQEQSVSEYSTARVEEGMRKTAWKAERVAEVGIAKTSKYAKSKLQERRLQRQETLSADLPFGYTGGYDMPETTGSDQRLYLPEVRSHGVNQVRESFPSFSRIKRAYDPVPAGTDRPGTKQGMMTREGMKLKREGRDVKGRRSIKTRTNRKNAYAAQAGSKQAYVKSQEAMRSASKQSYRMAKSGTGIVKRIAEGFANAVKTTFLGAKALILAAAGGSTVAVVIIVVCCFLGYVMYFSEEGDFKDYKPMIVTVAESQVGNEGGETFWRWYGFQERVDWCAIFVSWCGEQCGYLDAEILPKFAVVGDGAEWFKEKRQWKTRRYTPKAGDIVFFDWENDRVMDHVGIVEKCENKTVYTIEGNSGNVCRKLHYEVKSKKIYGYGVPVYKVR
ncbi:MAG: CHAP domain-containing protein [Firmicutes bacterium]|nr:CHAP domain-containing protein [Bacillota bacterium]